MNRSHLPAIPLTQGPLFHWFAYYDKLQFDPSQRLVLCNEVDFEGRSPVPGDTIRVGMVDRDSGNEWIELGTSAAWCWQQGCMLQWMPGSADTVLWSDLEDGRYVCRLLDVKTRERRTVPHPVYAVGPDGRRAVAPDFRRIQDMRPGYGYAPLPDPNADVLAPEDEGIHLIDLETGEADLVITIADVAAIPYREDLSLAKHYFNHLLFSPDGSRFVFLHRWRMPDGGTFHTRMMTANADGSDVRVVDDGGRTSHFIWRDPAHILAWALHPETGWGFYVFPDGPGEPEPVGTGVMDCDGHCTYLPGGEWIVNDTYPRTDNKRELYLYHVPTGEKLEIGRFDAGEHGGELRCDLHPRHSPDGRLLTIDSVHEGNGRQLYLVDIGEALDRVDTH